MLCPLLELVSLVTPKVSYQRQQNGASKVIIKVFPRGMPFVYMPLLPHLMILLLVVLFQEGNLHSQNVQL